MPALFLEQAGFTELRSDDYDKNPSMYTISTVMGHQTVSDGDGSFKLIAAFLLLCVNFVRVDRPESGYIIPRIASEYEYKTISK